MKLSRPIHQLKRRSKRQAREAGIPLHAALDQTARQEGFGAWSLLVAKTATAAPATRLLDQLEPGDLVLVGGRPGQGKTLVSLQLAVEAMRRDRHAAFFTLEYAEQDVLKRFRALGVDLVEFDRLFSMDCSDAISADHIIRKLGGAPRGTVAVIDYLQLLDQKRETPELAIQVAALRKFARERGMIIVLISQIDRAYDRSKKPFPDLADIRLPNPLDLKLFDKTCFVQAGEIRFQANG